MIAKQSSVSCGVLGEKELLGGLKGKSALLKFRQFHMMESQVPRQAKHNLLTHSVKKKGWSSLSKIFRDALPFC